MRLLCRLNQIHGACVLLPSRRESAIARLFITFLAPAGASEAGPPPPFVAVPPGLVADLLIVINQVIMVPIAASAGWMTFAKGFEGLLG